MLLKSMLIRRLQQQTKATNNNNKTSHNQLSFTISYHCKTSNLDTPSGIPSGYMTSRGMAGLRINKVPPTVQSIIIPYHIIPLKCT